MYLPESHIFQKFTSQGKRASVYVGAWSSWFREHVALPSGDRKRHWEYRLEAVLKGTLQACVPFNINKPFLLSIQWKSDINFMESSKCLCFLWYLFTSAIKDVSESVDFENMSHCPLVTGSDTESIVSRRCWKVRFKHVFFPNVKPLLLSI